MAVIGYATLQVIPSMRGLDSALRKELSGANSIGVVAGEQIGQGVSGRFRSAIGGLMSGAGAVISAAATGVGLVAGTALGLSLVTGFSRVTTIQDATRALTLTLGDATKAGALLAEVLKIVTGTPFALDQFAAGAQQLISFGVKAEAVPGILTAVGDAASSQGKRAGEFAGRLIEVFGQIAAKGRVQLEDVWRISETGVNALGILANHFGVTTTAMQKMISKGTVPAGEGIDALVKGIEKGSTGIAGQTVALGGLAQSLGDTLSGSFANLKISFARFGASIITPLTGPLTNFFKSLRTGIDDLGKKLGPKLAELVASPGFVRLLEWLKTVPAQIGPVVASLGELGPALAPVLAALAAVATTNLGNTLGPLGALLPAINPVVAAIAVLIATQPALREAFGRLIEAVQPLVAVLGPILVGALVLAANTLVTVLVPAINAVSSVLEFLRRNQDVLAALGIGLAAVAVAIGVTLIPAFLAWAAAATAAAVATLLAAAPFILLGVAVAAVALVIIKNWDSIKAAFVAVFDWVRDNWPLLLAILTGPIGLAVLAIVKNFDTIKGAFVAVKNAIAKGIDEAVDFFKKLPGRIISALGNVKDMLFNAGRQIIEGLIRGIGSMFGAVKDKAVDLGKKIIGWKGPPAKDAVLLYRNGQLIISGLVNGLESQFGAVESSLGALGSSFAGFAPASPAVSPFSVGNAPPATGVDDRPLVFELHVDSQRIATANSRGTQQRKLAFS